MQFRSTVALRADAEAGAWVRLVPAAWAARIDRFDGWPLPPALRLARAREALERGDDALALAELGGMQPSVDRYQVAGRLAENRGDALGAVRAYVAAGDLAALQAHVAALLAGGDARLALQLENEIVSRLQRDRTEPDALAEANFQLGVLLEAQAAAAAGSPAQRRARERLSVEAYARAVSLAPLEERYLLGLGNQQLNFGDVAAAERTFARAREADPSAAEPLTGLGDAALRRGDRTAARQDLERARRLNPDSDAAGRLARKLGR